MGKLYEANIEKMDSSSYYSWVTLRCNKASLLSQTHPDLAIKEYQETLKLFKYFPHQRLEETCRINLNNLDVLQPELDVGCSIRSAPFAWSRSMNRSLS